MSYPYPVLGNEDDVASEFSVSNFRYETQATRVSLNFDVATNDPDALKLLADGLGVLALRLMCGRTFYNNTKVLSLRPTKKGWHCLIDVDADLLDGPTKVEPLLLAAQPLQCFSWSRQHTDFFDEVFDIPANAVIGTCGDATIDIRKSYDPLRPPLASFMTFHQDAEQKEEFRVLVSAEGIDVRIRQDLFKGFCSMESAPALQVNAVVLPALMQALVEIFDPGLDEDTKESAWCQGLLKILEERGLGDNADDVSALERAQSLLEDPLNKLLLADPLGINEGEEDEG